MAGLTWSPRAIADLAAICEFIARDSERFACLFGQRLLTMIESIPKQPLLGAVVSEYQATTCAHRVWTRPREPY